MSLRSEMVLDAKMIMRDGLLRTDPSAVIDERGYVDDWRSNLLAGVDPDPIETDLSAGKGGELKGKFRAAHSSAALAVNVFGPFRDGKAAIPIPGVGDVKIEQFERTFPTGVAGRTPPHLDIAARGEHGVVAIESKCLEFLTPKAARFSPAYEELIQFVDTPWFSEMQRLNADPLSYSALDAAQLIKHAFGLMNSAGQGATLVYLFWEPDDSERHEIFRRHREEIARFEEQTRSEDLRFISFSYPELWGTWKISQRKGLIEHTDRLRRRYSGRLGSYEGYSRVNGRKTDENFFEDVD